MYLLNTKRWFLSWQKIFAEKFWKQKFKFQHFLYFLYKEDKHQKRFSSNNDQQLNFQILNLKNVFVPLIKRQKHSGFCFVLIVLALKEFIAKD